MHWALFVFIFQFVCDLFDLFDPKLQRYIRKARNNWELYDCITVSIIFYNAQLQKHYFLFNRTLYDSIISCILRISHNCNFLNVRRCVYLFRMYLLIYITNKLWLFYYSLERFILYYVYFFIVRRAANAPSTLLFPKVAWFCFYTRILGFKNMWLISMR